MANLHFFKKTITTAAGNTRAGTNFCVMICNDTNTDQSDTNRNQKKQKNILRGEKNILRGKRNILRGKKNILGGKKNILGGKPNPRSRMEKGFFKGRKIPIDYQQIINNIACSANAERAMVK